MKKVILFAFLLFFITSAQAQKKKTKGKSDKEKKATTDYQQSDPVADTATKFTGVIKYYMTTDDPSERDSMFIIFAEDKIKVTMFYPGYKPEDIFEDNYIANFKDTTLLVLDNRKKTYKTERLGARNEGTEMSLANYRKTGLVMKLTCKEYSGEMTMKDGDVFEAAALVSSHHSYINTVDYNFLNIQPVVLGYKIVLGYRTKTPDNENTYIIAYKIEPGDPAAYFDLAGYKAL
ncbi:MAG TPA: hypothetical protein VGO58_03390 [Chitinophagaceae bacterium]|jgi:hypothetical protein|nr:hypothetical protein [Chitinophagaceae bacterium]